MDKYTIGIRQVIEDRNLGSDIGYGIGKIYDTYEDAKSKLVEVADQVKQKIINAGIEPDNISQKFHDDKDMIGFLALSWDKENNKFVRTHYIEVFIMKITGFGDDTNDKCRYRYKVNHDQYIEGIKFASSTTPIYAKDLTKALSELETLKNDVVFKIKNSKDCSGYCVTKSFNMYEISHTKKSADSNDIDDHITDVVYIEKL